jgi:DNA-binding NtrC family response regulator
MKALSGSVGEATEPRIRVLVVEPLEIDRETMSRFLTAWNFEPVTARNSREAREVMNGSGASIAIISHPARSMEGIELVRELRQSDPGLETIMLASDDTPNFVTDAFRAGVYDCLKSPTDFKQLIRDLNTLREAVHRRMERAIWETEEGAAAALEGMVGVSAPMQAVFASIRRFAAEDEPVLVTGLIGTGKELAARALHSLSRRAAGPLAVYRCCGVGEGLAAVELFGGPLRSVRADEPQGDSTPAGQGIFESARGGTLVLDEIGDLPVSIQERLAKVMQEDGDAPPKGRAADSTIRVVAATRLNLAELAVRGHFCGELYRLLSGNVIHLPSLSERQGDIPLLCRHFQARFNLEYGKTTRAFSPAGERALLSYPWPGNVRELENVIGRACLLADQEWIELADLSIAAPLSAMAWPERQWSWSCQETWRPEIISMEKTARKGRVNGAGVSNNCSE